MPRGARIVLSTVAAVLAGAAPAPAGPGSGTSGYGGGGGGFSGGGGSYGGGSGSGEGDPWVVVVVVGIFVALFLLGLIAHARYVRKRRRRVRTVQLAAAEAAGDDAAFAPDAVCAAARSLFMEVAVAWDRRDRARLGELVGADLLVEWDRRLDDFERKRWHNRVEVLSGPQIEYVGLVNRSADADDRAVVRIEARMKDYVEGPDGARIMRKGEADTTTALCEYWTLAKRHGRWTVESVEQRAEGDHHLDGEIIATPWADGERLRAEAVAERAAAEAALPGVQPAELADVDFYGEARAAALDLALADGRFDPELIEASVQRAVAAWAQAVDGDDGALAAVARPGAVRQMLHPDDPSAVTRLVVRGPRVRRVAITALDAAAEPPSVRVEIEVCGRRYIENRDTAAIVSGSRDIQETFTESWVLGLEGPPDWPWRIVRAGDLAPA